MTWPAALLWPGQNLRRSFRAKVGEELRNATLQPTLSAHAFWPNTDSLSAIQRQVFTDHEDRFVGSATLAVKEFVAGADTTPPAAHLTVSERPAGGQPQRSSCTSARTAMQTSMYLRAWTLDPATGNWVVAQNTGWLPYAESYTLTLTSSAGVHYLGLWVADKTGNISTLSESSLAFTNLIGLSQQLGDGERQQYRVELGWGESVDLRVTVSLGDVTLYAWAPHNAAWPTALSALSQSGLRDDLTLSSEDEGLYLVEALALGDSEYTLITGDTGSASSTLEAAGASLLSAKAPTQPLTVTTPLSAGLGAAPFLTHFSLPLMFKK